MREHQKTEAERTTRKETRLRNVTFSKRNGIFKEGTANVGWTKRLPLAKRRQLKNREREKKKEMFRSDWGNINEV